MNIGDVAGSLCKRKGYIYIHIFNKCYVAHRLAWLYVYGEWPAFLLDHKNLVKSDNRIDNLRPASYVQNTLNQPIRKDNSSGYRGVNWDKRRQKWVVNRLLNKRRVYLGSFDDVHEAGEVSLDFAKKHHGDFFST